MGSPTHRQTSGNTGFLEEYSLWLLAIIPLLTNIVVTITSAEFSGLYYLYFGLSATFLALDLSAQRHRGNPMIWRFIMGLLLLPAYLILNQEENIPKRWGPLIVWTVLFVFYLSVVSVFGRM